ncbi:hypothetical protein KUTeg_003523, partial [Tegillarca granosa]
MAESNYHFEARRKERLIERKHEALARLSKGGELGDCTCTSDLKGNTGTKNTQIMYSGPGDFDNNSLRLNIFVGPSQKIYHRKIDNNPEDKVYPLIHPEEYEISRPKKQLPPRKPHYKISKDMSIYNWIGTARDRRQYDHSRNGPLLDSTWYSLRKEMMGLGKGTPLYGEGYSLTFEDLQRVKVVTPK